MFHGSSPYSFRENYLNTKKFTLPPPPMTTMTTPEKQYICLASASQARQKREYEQGICLYIICFTICVKLIICVKLMISKVGQLSCQLILKNSLVKNWARLFKTNDVVS